jgi:hypothetical protein
MLASRRAVLAPPVGGGGDGVDRPGRPGTRVGDGGQQAEHLHRLEHVLGIGATAVVAPQRQVDPGFMKLAQGRHPVLVLEVADRVVDEVAAGLGQGLDLLR